jgi:hypothetical protein
VRAFAARGASRLKAWRGAGQRRMASGRRRLRRTIQRRPGLLRLAVLAASLAAAALVAWATVKWLARFFRIQADSQPGPRLLAGPVAALPRPPEPVLRMSRELGILLVMSGVFVLGLMAAGTLDALVADERPADYRTPLPPQPRIGAELLEGYHWVDQPGGSVQIPIERAMDLLMERGLPVRAVEAAQFRDQGLGGPPASSGGRSIGTQSESTQP